MWLIKYSRPLVLFLLIAICGPFGIWLMETGHRWLPLLVIVGYMVVANIVMRKLPRLAMSPEENRRLLLRVAASTRRLGFMSAIGLGVTTLLLLIVGFRIEGLPRWGVALALLWSWFLVWCYFRGTEWYKRRAEALGHEIQRENK